MAWKNHKPPSGIPAKGAGVGDARPFTGSEGVKIGAERQPPAIHKSIGRMEAKEYRERLRALLEKSVVALERGLDSENVDHGLKAAVAIEKRLFGDYKQTIETQEDTRTDDEIRAEIARRQKELGV